MKCVEETTPGSYLHLVSDPQTHAEEIVDKNAIKSAIHQAVQKKREEILQSIDLSKSSRQEQKEDLGSLAEGAACAVTNLQTAEDQTKQDTVHTAPSDTVTSTRLRLGASMARRKHSLLRYELTRPTSSDADTMFEDAALQTTKPASDFYDTSGTVPYMHQDSSRSLLSGNVQTLSPDASTTSCAASVASSEDFPAKDFSDWGSSKASRSLSQLLEGLREPRGSTSLKSGSLWSLAAAITLGASEPRSSVHSSFEMLGSEAVWGNLQTREIFDIWDNLTPVELGTGCVLCSETDICVGRLSLHDDPAFLGDDADSSGDGRFLDQTPPMTPSFEETCVDDSLFDASFKDCTVTGPSQDEKPHGRSPSLLLHLPPQDEELVAASLQKIASVSNAGCPPEQRLRLLVVGDVAATYTIACRLCSSSAVDHVFVYPGNDSTAKGNQNVSNFEVFGAHNKNWPSVVASLAKIENVDLVVISSDTAVKEEVAARFRDVAIPCIPPYQDSSIPEYSVPAVGFRIVNHFAQPEDDKAPSLRHKMHRLAKYMC